MERANVEATLKTRETQLAFLDEISQLMAVAEPEGQILNGISERIARQLDVTHCTFLDVDSLGYLSLEGMVGSSARSPDRFCSACWSGRYPTEIPAEATTSGFVAEPA